MPILTAEDVYTPVPGRPAACWAPMVGILGGRTICVPPADDARSEKTLPVFVNDGRWVFVCACGGAQVASAADRRFWCHECRAETGWTDTAWPDDDMAEAAEVLAARPDARSRNWKPWEQSVDALRAENDAHGVRL